MMKLNSILFVDRSDAGSRRFVPGFITQEGETSIHLQFEEEMDFKVNDRVLTRYQSGEEFVERTYEVAQVLDGVGSRFEFRPHGNASRGESRNSKRVPTVFASFMATFAGESDCPVLDISEEGLALIANPGHEIGESKDFEMWIQDGHYQGSLTVQSVQPQRRGRCRYGLKCNPDEEDQNLGRSLWMLCVALQVKRMEHSFS